LKKGQLGKFVIDSERLSEIGGKCIIGFGGMDAPAYVFMGVPRCVTKCDRGEEGSKFV